jgi:hypothetical protein
MITGQNTALSNHLGMTGYTRCFSLTNFIVARLDAAYCLDAPVVLPAGSWERYSLGDGSSMPCETLIVRGGVGA